MQTMNMEQKDRIGQYLVPHLGEMVFDELSAAYLAKAGLADILTDVPVPLRKTELNSITALSIARNMAFVIGCDPGFQYKENYLEYIRRGFGDKFAEGLLADGVEGAAKNDYDYACIQFRAAIQLDPECADAYYCYGRACKDAYEMASGVVENISEATEAFIGRFKAEALEAFEVATLKDPKLAPAHYFLGYAYVNMGLYMKAKLSWDEYLKLTRDEVAEAPEKSEIRELYKEILDRVRSLEKPVEIEKGYNLVLSGKFEEGIAALNEYKEGEFAGWWPLWYYLGMAHEGLEQVDEAIAAFLKVLQYAPSNLEAMAELVQLYTVTGDQEKVDKYTKKIALVKGNQALDRQLAEENAHAAAEKLQAMNEALVTEGTGKRN